MIQRYPQRRLLALAALLSFAFTLVVARLVWVQVVRAEPWRERARQINADEWSEAAARGRILDRNGAVLALSERLTKVGVTQPARWSQGEDLERLAAAIQTTPERLRADLRGRERHTVVARSVSLTPEDRAWMRRQPTITLDDRWRRTHPLGDLAASLLGRLRESGDAVSGLEKVYDEILTGRAGTSYVRFAGDGTLLSRVTLEPPVDGADLVLTIDAYVQQILETELERARVEARAHRAQGIVLDLRSGEVLALAQGPAAPESLEDLGDVDPHRVMASADMFEPGSTFKIFTMASLLSRAVCDTARRYDGLKKSPGQRVATKRLGPDFVIRDVHPVGVVSLRHAYVVSSNIIFATAADALRQREFESDLRSFGFGSVPGTALPAETAGKLRPAAEWSDRSLGTLAIGQEVGVSLLQLVAGYAAVVGDGTLRTPAFVRETVWPDGQRRTRVDNVRRRGVVPPSVIPTLRSLCRDVVDEDYGTGDRARVQGLSVGGKTGTAQISTRHGYLRGAYTPSFVGFVPVEDPRLLVAVVLHRAPGEEIYGGNSAAPCFQRVVQTIASTTSYLDARDAVAAVEEPAWTPLPDLVGRSAREVETALRGAGCRLSQPAPNVDALAVGQLPCEGTLVAPGTPVQVAWMREGR